MTLWLRQSTASQEILLGPFVSNTDGDSPETGLTIANTDIKIWVEGGTTLANKNSGGATHISGGNYYTTLDDTDTATLGKMEIHCHPSGALAIKRDYLVLPAIVFDSLMLGSDDFGGLIDANIIADALLKRDWTSVTGEAARSVLNALRFLRNKWSVSAGTLTVTKEDDSTSAWTASVTSDAAADPITGSDPA